ncbi:unnamed protein product [Peronospora belbahrii]|uniref:Uncharacterized protein n=1 Tax=Peronospora belbahrii TaxID=622444 RepID=A0AAU9KJD3_9STRA|nr:unnamed protein product [Peronospora belbahrii]
MTAEVDEDKATTNKERDVGVSNKDWEELQHAKKDYIAHLNALRQARDDAKLEEEQCYAKAIEEKIRQICPCPAGCK